MCRKPVQSDGQHTIERHPGFGKADTRMLAKKKEWDFLWQAEYLQNTRMYLERFRKCNGSRSVLKIENHIAKNFLQINVLIKIERRVQRPTSSAKQKRTMMA